MARVLIVGAGLSGLIAARELKTAGHDVVIVEKNAGIGGRMATQREGDATFDSGAQFFTARRVEFKEAVAHWHLRGIAEEWFEGYPSPRNEKAHDVYSRFRGAQGMKSIAEFLARDLEIHCGEEIEKLHFENGIWMTQSKSGREYSSDRLLLTAPVPQSLALLDSSNRALSQSTRELLESVSYEPCFSVLAILKSASKIPAPGALYLSEEPISWLADNFQKGISAREGAITIHSTGKFAKENFDGDENEIGKVLLGAVQKYLGAPVESFQVQCWEYSKAEQILDEGAVFIPELNLCFAGDGLCGAKIEGAFCSGLEAAELLGAN